MYLLLLSIIYLAFISLGLPDSLLGAAWPVMRQTFDVPVSYMGVVSMIISGGTICSSLMSERLTKRFGTRYVTLVSVFLTAVALFGFSTASQFVFVCLWAIPYGLGAGAIDAALNNYVSIHYNARHMSWLHCFWGVGTIISPYIMSYALAKSAWSSGYRAVSFVQFGIVIVLACTLPVWNIHKKKTDEEKEPAIIGLKGALKIKGVPWLLFGFFAYCAAEATAMLWTSSYLVGVRNVSEKTGAAFASLFFIGITVGRFVSGLISDRLGDRNMIRLGIVVALSGALLVMLPFETDLPTLTGFIVIGLGCAPVYPSIIHSTPYNFGVANSQAIIGIQMASAYIGSTFMPPLFGVLSNITGLSLMPFFIAAFLLMTIIMVEKSFEKSKRTFDT
ncbi:MAG: MFS transporter [Eubacteriales bacterium]|nr:MFS transporter [Lachnospiraceae bacterium]MDO5126330.1 MFS transporter [Eubacteriales bacterium]